MTTLGLAGFCGASLGLTATLLFQFRPFSRRFTTLDRLGLLPRWLFFSNGRGNHDCHILVRDRNADGAVGGWEQVAQPDRPLWTAVWHPTKHTAGLLWHAAEVLNGRQRAGAHEEGAETSLCYLSVLTHCMYKHPRSKEARARQFALVETTGRTHRDLWVGFTSDFHPF